MYNNTAVAVSNATVHLASDLKKTMRGVDGLKNTLGKSEVSFFFWARHKCEALAIFYVLRVFSNLFFFFFLKVQNNILVQNLVQSALKINELELLVILKKVDS
jgi:hypothetical protein